MRAMFDKDIASGTIPLWNNYSTSGPSSTWHIKNTVPDPPEPECYILNPEWTCTDEVYATVKDNTALIKDYIVIDLRSRERVSQPIFNLVDGNDGSERDPSFDDSGLDIQGFQRVIGFVDSRIPRDQGRRTVGINAMVLLAR